MTELLKELRDNLDKAQREFDRAEGLPQKGLSDVVARDLAIMKNRVELAQAQQAYGLGLAEELGLSVATERLEETEELVEIEDLGDE